MPDTIRVCYGDTAQLIATGEENHAWAQANYPSSIIETDSIFRFKPLSNTLINFYGSFDTLQTYVEVVPFDIDLGDDIPVCGDRPFWLENPAMGADTSWWHGLGSADSIEITGSGWYALSAIKNGCMKTDSINVQVLYPDDYALEVPEPTCLGRPLALSATTLNHVSHRWDNGSTDSLYTVHKDGWYYLHIDHPCGSMVDSVQVEFERCVCKFFLPNAFTPNGDGLNDSFKPVFKCHFEEYFLRIANRWGEEVFETNDPEQAWDGQGAPPGIYLLKIYYRGLNEEGQLVEDLIEETFTLLR